MDNRTVQEEMKQLIEKLNRASEAYYAQNMELISNYEYDKLYDRLVSLEESSGIVLASSPTIHVGYEAVEELPKERHEKPMLSLAKTKNREELRDFLAGNTAILSWKLDGLTVVLQYYDGKLAKAVTRGNGEVGEVITNNAKVFQNIPLKIAYKGELILRGEAVISYKDFEEINEKIPEATAKYKNPRNLCSGSVRQLNNQITAKRNVRFFAFSLVKAEGVDFENSREKQMLFLKDQGFDIVDYRMVNPDTILDAINWFAEKIRTYEIPSDGLVLSYDDLQYSASLGTTAKYPRDSMAFKWTDETAETTLREVEWSPSRTGLINPVAIFDAVELEGTTVTRASVHNVSIVRALKLGIGDRITVYKANMIIPQIAENLTMSNTLTIPDRCPVCGAETRVVDTGGASVLMCSNPDCTAKKLKSFTLFVSRDAMNIDGLSEMTLEKFIGKGFIHHYADLFKLAKYREQIVEMEGFGEKSYQNLIDSLNAARETVLSRVIYGLGIANIGLATAKLICRDFQDDLEAMRTADVERLCLIEGVGEVIAQAFCDYFRDEKKSEELALLLPELSLKKEAVQSGDMLTLQGKVFVVTGSLERFPNRNALKDEVEKRGGKVTGSVTGKTDALINNDTTSQSTKNKKARELGIPILSEEDFISMYLE